MASPFPFLSRRVFIEIAKGAKGAMASMLDRQLSDRLSDSWVAAT
jgi:hypothetical protein